MARMIGFRPPEEDYYEESRRGRSSRTGRYTRMGDDSSIYLMVTDLLDPLMSIAAGGLY